MCFGINTDMLSFEVVNNAVYYSVEDFALKPLEMVTFTNVPSLPLGTRVFLPQASPVEPGICYSTVEI